MVIENERRITSCSMQTIEAVTSIVKRARCISSEHYLRFKLVMLQLAGFHFMLRLCNIQMTKMELIFLGAMLDDIAAIHDMNTLILSPCYVSACTVNVQEIPDDSKQETKDKEVFSLWRRSADI